MEVVNDAPENCPDCGQLWSSGEWLHTGDDKAHKGMEMWLYCKACKCEMFYPDKLVENARK